MAHSFFFLLVIVEIELFFTIIKQYVHLFYTTKKTKRGGKRKWAANVAATSTSIVQNSKSS
jgi:hypothetical protein